MKRKDSSQPPSAEDFLAGKPAYVISLYHQLIAAFNGTGNVTAYPTKTMIGISNGQRCIAWITAIGKDFIHVVFPFKQPHNDNLCFIKIARVPGDAHRYNHHFRMYAAADINEEVRRFMKLAYIGESLSNQ